MLRLGRFAPLYAALLYATWLHAAAVAQTISPRQLNEAARDKSVWLSYGRDFKGQRYVELNQITPKNAQRLGRRGCSPPAVRIGAWKLLRSCTTE